MAKDKGADQGGGGSNPFGDLGAMLEQFKVPGLDMSSFMDERRKDVEALVAANTAAFEAMQKLAAAQRDMLTQVLQGMQQSAAGLTSGKTGMPDAAQQAEAAAAAWQKMLADLKTLAEMAQKSQAEAVASLTARARENLESVQKLMTPK